VECARAGAHPCGPAFCSGGKICLTDHFKPLWARNVGKFGIAHAMALGVRGGAGRGAVLDRIICEGTRQCSHGRGPRQLAPWLAVEIPDMIGKGSIVHTDKPAAP
jgi:hypothetical protein